MSFINIISGLLGSQPGSPPPDYSWLNNSVLVFDGNSLTAGQGASAGMDYPAQLVALIEDLGVTGLETHNFGVSGQMTSQMSLDAATQIDPLINVGVLNILFAWEIGNDIYYNGNTTNAETAFQSYCSARQSAGWDYIIVIGLTPRNQSTSFGDNVTTYNSKLQTADTWLKTNYGTFSDAFVDVRADSRLDDYTDTTYFSDGTHYTNAGYGVVAGLAFTKVLAIPH